MSGKVPAAGPSSPRPARVGYKRTAKADPKKMRDKPAVGFGDRQNGLPNLPIAGKHVYTPRRDIGEHELSIGAPKYHGGHHPQWRIVSACSLTECHVGFILGKDVEKLDDQFGGLL